VEQWFQNTRGLVIVVLAVITAAVLLAVEPGDGFPSGVSSSSDGGGSVSVTTTVTTTPGPTTTTVARPTLAQGTPDTANTVVLQTRLLQLGYTGVGNPDGNFGPATTTAVKQFQTDHGLPPSGTVDQATWNALSSASPTTTTAAK
jgi:peptidoglycan hydrolase-like protein with peptidoglycan-binding domain